MRRFICFEGGVEKKGGKRMGHGWLACPHWWIFFALSVLCGGIDGDVVDAPKCGVPDMRLLTWDLIG